MSEQRMNFQLTECSGTSVRPWLSLSSEAWTSRCTSRHQSPSTAISHRFHAELYMTFPSAKTSWLCALWHLHIHLKETEAAFFLTEPQWKFPLSAPIRYHSWPKRRKRRVRWNKVEVGKKWKSPCLVNGPLILSPDRRQWQHGGGSGHQLAWIDTFLSRLQLSLLRASTDCNISFFPPSWKSQQPFSCHWKAGRQALCLFTQMNRKHCAKSLRITKLFSIAYKIQNLRTCLEMTGWLAVVISGCVGLIFSCVSSVGAFIHSGYIEAVAFNKVTRLENIWIKWHLLPWMDQIDLSW